MKNTAAALTIAALNPPRRLLLGPGPSPVDDRVYRATAAPLVGHLDPFFVRTMDELQALLRDAFETNNRLTNGGSSSSLHPGRCFCCKDSNNLSEMYHHMTSQL